MVSSAQLNQVRAWVNQRRRHYMLTTADDLWKYINKNWGHLPEHEREEIYQKADSPGVIK